MDFLTLMIYIISVMALLVILDFSVSKYLKYKERKSAARLQFLLMKARLRLGENNVYSKRQ